MADEKNIKKISRNLWEGRYFYFNGENKKKYKEVFGKTKKEVEKKLKHLKKLFGNEIRQLTVSEVCDIWLVEKQNEVTALSFDRYKSYVEKTIKPYLGEKSFFDINEKDLNKFKEDLHNSLKESSVVNVMQVLRLIIKFVESDGIKNNKKDNNTKKGSMEDLIILSSTDVKQLISYTNQNVDNMSLGIAIVLRTGIGLSEMAALKWSDIDLKNRSITINKTLERISRILPDQKSKTELVIMDVPERVIPISKKLLEYLNQFSLRNGFVTSGTEKPFEPRALQYQLKAICRNNGLPECSYSVLRNTFIVNALKSGCNIVLLEKILKIEFSQLEKYFSLVKLTNRKKISEISKLKY